MPRYPEEPMYQRPREAPRRDDRDIRRPIDPMGRDRTTERDYRMEEVMDSRMDPRMDTRMDTRMNMDQRMEPRIENRMDIKPEPRANTGRQVRTDPRGETMYRDVETGHLYQQPPAIRRTPYADEFDDIPPPNRPIIDPGLAPGQPKPNYNEYFVPGKGIDREVIQREICRYLGQDATCRPGKSPDDGRSGFIVRAYRALTSEMIRSLQESSEKFWSEKERRRQTGRGAEMQYEGMQDNRDYGYYETPMAMDMDMDDRPSMMPTSRIPREVDMRMDPRPPAPRHAGLPPTTAAYMQDPGFPAYNFPNTVPPPHTLQYDSRTYASGNTPPPPPGGVRVPHTGFAPGTYPARTTQVTSAGMPAPVFRDTSDRMRDYPPANAGRRK